MNAIIMGTVAPKLALATVVVGPAIFVLATVLIAALSGRRSEVRRPRPVRESRATALPGRLAA